MHITLYSTDSEPEKVDKSLSASLALTGTLRNESNVINPRIMVEADAGTLAGKNYAYIPEFDRYYFISDVISVRNNVSMIIMHVDVLMSFRSQIRANYAFLEKQKDAGNRYLNDGSWFHDSRQFYTVKSFPNGFNDTGKFILITAGA